MSEQTALHVFVVLALLHVAFSLLYLWALARQQRRINRTTVEMVARRDEADAKLRRIALEQLRPLYDSPATAAAPGAADLNQVHGDHA